MKPKIIILFFSLILLSLSCNETVDSDFEKILGTYSGSVTYFYTGRPNGVFKQEQDAGQATITVTAVSKKDKTFRISGTGLAADAFLGYDDGIYTWDSKHISAGPLYSATQTEGGIGPIVRNISTRFSFENGSVISNYEQRVNADTSTESIDFEGVK